MIDNHLVVDAVVHPYDLAPANQVETARERLDAVYAAHHLAVDAAHQIFVQSHDEFFSDFSDQAMARAEFVESLPARLS
jgi:uncharacterized protein